MNNQVSPPVATTARPAPLARAKLAKVQGIRFGLQASPVSLVEPAEALRLTLLYCFVISATASATAEFGTSMIASTLSTWYHCRAMLEPISGLFWWSAEMTVTFSALFGFIFM